MGQVPPQTGWDGWGKKRKLKTPSVGEDVGTVERGRCRWGCEMVWPWQSPAGRVPKRLNGFIT